MEGHKYYGAKATINVWEPKIQQPNEFCLSQMWILGGSFGEDLNSIEAGWQVLFLFLFLFLSNLTKEHLNYPCSKLIFQLSTNFFDFAGKLSAFTAFCLFKYLQSSVISFFFSPLSSNSKSGQPRSIWR